LHRVAKLTSTIYIYHSGITQNTPEGYEEADIYKLTSDLVEEYIKKPEMVVLVVIPADSDFQNAAALKLAKKYDPDGDRTLGVVTKVNRFRCTAVRVRRALFCLCSAEVNPCSSQQVDKVPHEHDPIVSRIHMEGNNMRLKLGFIAVRNRTPGEIDKGLNSATVKAKEKGLFKTHPLLSKIRKDCVGFDNLSARIVDLQAKRLKDSIPETLRSLTKQVATLERDLARLPPATSSYEDCVLILHGVLNGISKALESLTTGERQGATYFDGEDAAKYSICPRSWEIMDKTANSLRKAMPDFLGEDMARLLEEELREYQGSGLPNLIGAPALHSIARHYLENALQPHCAQLTEELTELQRQVAVLLVNKEAAAYPRLRQELGSIIVEHLEECKTKTDEFLATLSRGHVRHLDTFNDYYLETVNKVRAAQMELKQDPASSLDGIDGNIVALLKRYVNPPAVSGFNAHTIAPGVGGLNAHTIPPGKGGSNEQQTILDHQISLHAYTKVVLKAFIDTTWHMSYELLLYNFHNSLVPTLSGRLTGQEKAKSLVALMTEDSHIARNRSYITERLACFKRNIPKLKEIRSTFDD
jgi:hypothetical protein